MVERLIELSARHKWIVFGVVFVLTLWAADSARKTPLDALPDISDPQVIVYTEWMGRSPDLVEDQITYPLVRTLQSTPGVVTVRGYSMFGMSFTYALFDEGTDIYWARTRVLEQLGRVQQLLPPDVTPTLGPDASGVGWVYQFVLKDSTGRMDVAELRALQDFTVRPALQAVAGVAEVASVGGFQRQYQIIIDPDRLVGFGLTLGDITRSVRDANAEVGARVLELAGREYVLRGRGYVKELADLERSVVTVGAGGVPVRLGDVARVQYGPDIRRGAADYNGTGETVGGIVVMRVGSNALQVIRALEAQIATLRLPDGVRLIPTYDRSELILGSVETLTNTLIQQAIIVTIICLVFLFHARSAVVVMIVLPLSVLMSFIGIRYLGLTSNIMSLGGIAIAIGELADAVIVLIENAHVRLAAAPPQSDRQRVIVDACKEVGRPIFFSLILITISFLPIFTLAGQAGRLFTPLAYTKTFAMFAAAILSITLAPPLMVLLLRGRFRTEATNPVSRLLSTLYRPVAVFVVRFRFLVVAAAVVLMIATVPVFQRLGSEFMPPLDEGSLLVMPTTFPGISIEEARRALVAQDRIIMRFPEVQSVHGKAGRAETATDPAQLDMIESVIMLRPRDAWPTRYTERWYSARAPDWLKNAVAPAPLAGTAAAHAGRTRARPGYRVAHAGIPDGDCPAHSDPNRYADDRRPHPGRSQGIRCGSERDRTHQRQPGRDAAAGAGHAQHVCGAPDRPRIRRYRPEPRCDRAIRPDRARRAGRRGSGHWRHARVDRDRRTLAVLNQLAVCRGPALGPASAPGPERAGTVQRQRHGDWRDELGRRREHAEQWDGALRVEWRRWDGRHGRRRRPSRRRRIGRDGRGSRRSRWLAVPRRILSSSSNGVSRARRYRWDSSPTSGSRPVRR